MRRLTTFTILSLNGHYKDKANSLSWHHHDEEGLEISRENLRADGTTLIFGRKTYVEFANFWPSKQAFSAFPEVAERMSQAEKVVFSRSLSTAAWANTRIARNDLADEIKRLKSAPGGGMTVLGSGEIVEQLTTLKLIDDYLFMIDPILLAQGRPLFGSIQETVQLELYKSRPLKNGSLLVHYRTASTQGDRDNDHR